MSGTSVVRNLGVAICLMLAACATTVRAEDVGADQAINFNRDIRPILSDKCYACHGPDGEKRESGLRFDIQEDAFAELESGSRAIVPGSPDESELVARITSDDEYLQMPPVDSERQLTADEKGLLKQWIEQGAAWEGHWSFIPPQRPSVPTAGEGWTRNPIDHFVFDKLQEAGLSPVDEATKVELIRRVTFDLTGLPPTIQEIETFLADTSDKAYESLVERLLDSPHYGEQMARYWLDAARYGDTHGLHLDNMRIIWPYRDWVIKAFNENKRFDTFTIEQLAGDLLPEPSLDQLVATGFNRCNVSTSEGGSIDAEYLVRYAVDRVETTSTVWLGLASGCAVCHDHKFDPLTMRDFYSMFAFFNSLTEKAMDGNKPDPPPTIRVPSAEQAAQLAELDTQIAGIEAELAELQPEVDAAQQVWESDWSQKLLSTWSVLNPIESTSTGGASLRRLDDATLLVEGTNPSQDTYEVVTQTDAQGIVALRLEAFTHEGLPNSGPGRSPNANFVLSEIEVEASPLDNLETVVPLKFASAVADYSQPTYEVAQAIDGQVGPSNGWAVAGHERHANGTAVFYLAEPLNMPSGAQLRIRMRHDSQFSQHNIGRFRLSVSDNAVLSPTRFGTWSSIGPFTATSGNEAYAQAFPPEESVQLDQTYNEGQLKWSTRGDVKEGEAVSLEGENAATYFHRTIDTLEARQVTLGLGSDDGLKVWLNSNLVLDRDVQRGVAPNQDRVVLDLQPGTNELLVKVVNYSGGYAFVSQTLEERTGELPLNIAMILSSPRETRSKEQSQAISDFYRGSFAPNWQATNEQATQVRKQRDELVALAPTSMIMQDMPEPRPAYVLIRGQYDQPSDIEVTPDVPKSLPPMPEGAPANRLGLAMWLVDPGHPLTSRVTVNRFWQRYFGYGIVRTPEDFGAQGEWPSHPLLLDWLATEFIESGWDIKAFQRMIVTSATYRQSSKVTPELLEKDPENKLLSRGPRYRMDAEMIRDNALAASGLLVTDIGGPSVKPYQPSGIWKAVGYTSSNTANFARDNGDALYRRSMYTFLKRTAPPPAMQTLDAPDRESCTVRRARTNTPLQALLLMNDIQFVEAARSLAERMMTEGGEDTASRIRYGFRLATSRLPDEAEVAVMEAAYDDHLAEYEKKPLAAGRLVETGEAPRDSTLNVKELAAWTMVANLILNLDETITKG